MRDPGSFKRLFQPLRSRGRGAKLGIRIEIHPQLDTVIIVVDLRNMRL